MAFSRNRGAGPAKGTLEYFEAQSNSARWSWIAILALTLLNTILIVFANSQTYYLFSSCLPMDFVIAGFQLYGMHTAGYGLAFAIGLIAFVLMLLPAIFWKKHTVWPLIAVITYVIDTAYLLWAYEVSTAVSELIFHVVILALMVYGYVNALKAAKARKAAEAPVFATEAAPAESENNANQYKGPEL